MRKHDSDTKQPRHRARSRAMAAVGSRYGATLNALAALKCQLRKVVPCADRRLLIAEVIHAFLYEGSAFVKFRGFYRQTTPAQFAANHSLAGGIRRNS